MYRILGVGWIHDNRLETAFQSSIFLDVLAVFINRRRTDALEFATGKRRLENVGSIQAAFGTARPHNRMQFVDEKNHRVADALEFHNQPLHAFFELAAVLGASHHGSHIERHDALVRQQVGNFLLSNLLRKALDNCSLAHARFTNKRRIVLLAAAKNLDQAFNFGFAADNRVQFARARHSSKVATEMFKNRSLGLGRRSRTRFIAHHGRNIPIYIHPRRVDILALDLLEHFQIIVKRNVVRRKRCRSRSIGLLENGEHQMFRANILIALVFRQFGRIEQNGLGAGRKREEAPTLVTTNGHQPTIRGERPLDSFTQITQVHLECTERLGSISRFFAHKAEQQVFNCNTVAAQVMGGHAGRLQHSLRLSRKNTVDIGHFTPPESIHYA